MLPLRLSSLAVVFFAGFVAAPLALAQPPATNDAFDVSRGAIVTSHSEVISSSPEDMLGAMSGGLQSGTLIFADATRGTIDFVEWTVPAPITVQGFNLYARGDAPLAPKQRTFDHFKLQAKVGNDFVTLYDSDVRVPYEYIEQPSLVVSSGVESVSSAHFRAEFRQYSLHSSSGPRVIELDGFSDVTCGDADGGNGVTATDALAALRTAVGAAGCAYCTCDVNSSNSVTASDALLLLQKSVDMSVPLSCPACFYPKSQKTTTTSTISISTSSSSIPF